MPLTLSIAGIGVELTRFPNNEYPRATMQALGAVEFSALGSAALQGSHFEPKFIWTISALVEYEQRALMEALAFEFQTRRRERIDCNILVYDTTATIVERSRTRDLVPNTSETLLPGSTHVSYYAQFNAAITDGPKYSASGRFDVLSLVLVETIKVSA